MRALQCLSPVCSEVVSMPSASVCFSLLCRNAADGVVALLVPQCIRSMLFVEGAGERGSLLLEMELVT